MANSHPDRRQYFMHPAHPTLGVGMKRMYAELGDGVIEFLARRVETPDRSSIAVVCHPADAQSQKTLERFQRMLAARADWQCNAFDLPGFAAAEHHNEAADGVLLIRDGLHIARRWSDLDALSFQADGGRLIVSRNVTIEPATAARWHPVLNGVRPFVYSGLLQVEPAIPTGATPLLWAILGTQQVPVAWTSDAAKTFSTTLCDEPAFGEAQFIGLLRNALGWVRRAG